MTEDVYTFISVPERDALYHLLLQDWLDMNRDMLDSVAQRIGDETLKILNGVLEEGLSVMDGIADRIEEES